MVGDPKIYNASGKRLPSVSFDEEQGSEETPILITSDDQPGPRLKRKRKRLPWPISAADRENEETSIHENKRVKIKEASQQRDYPAAPADNKARFQHFTGGQKPRIHTGIMTAERVILQHITKVSSRVVDGTISDDCFSILGWQHGVEDRGLKDLVWRTLVADRGADGKNAPACYKRACVYTLRKTSAERDLNTSKLFANKSIPESVTEYLKRVQSVVWIQKFFECTQQYHRLLMDHEKENIILKNEKNPHYFMQRLVGLGSKNITEDYARRVHARLTTAYP